MAALHNALGALTEVRPSWWVEQLTDGRTLISSSASVAVVDANGAVVTKRDWVCSTYREGWEVLYATGVIPYEWLDEPRRRFTIRKVMAQGRALPLVDYVPWAGDVLPMSFADMVTFAASVSFMVTAEAYARDVLRCDVVWCAATPETDRDWETSKTYELDMLLRTLGLSLAAVLPRTPQCIVHAPPLVVTP